jgi:DNA-binding XRE family transcriptional regulator
VTRRLTGPAWEKRRQQVLERDGHLCQLCRRYEAADADHIVPVSLGGTNDLSNLQAACEFCNGSKHAALWTDDFIWGSLTRAQHGLTARVARDQRRLAQLEALMEQVRPWMEHDSTCTVAEALRRKRAAEGIDEPPQPQEDQSRPPLQTDLARRHRHAQEKTQAEVAAQLGVGLEVFARWERGRSQPPITKAVQWAQLLGLPLVELMPILQQPGKVRAASSDKGYDH